MYSLVRYIDPEGRSTDGLVDWCYSGEEARAALMFHNLVTHSTLMFRRECAPSPTYASEFTRCEDYNLIAQLADSRGGLRAIPRRLVAYRIHASNATKSSGAEMKSLSRRLRSRLLSRAGLNPTSSELDLHDCFEGGAFDPTRALHRRLLEWVEHLREAVRRSGNIELRAFDRVLGDEWLSLSHRFAVHGREAWRVYREGPGVSSLPSLPSVVSLWIKAFR